MLPLVVSALGVVVGRNGPVIAWAIAAWLVVYFARRAVMSSR